MQAAANAYKEAYALDLAYGVLDGKEGTTVIAHVQDTDSETAGDQEAYSFMKGFTYSVNAQTGAYTFETAAGENVKWLAKFDSTKGNWEVKKAQ